MFNRLKPALKSFFIPSVFISSLLIILTACSRGEGVETNEIVKVDEPDSFAAFINPVAGLASGAYSIIAATDTAGDSGDFTLSIRFDNGETQAFNGSWTAASNEKSFSFTMQQAGGITITLTSDVENNLRLLNANGFQIAAKGAGTSGDTRIVLKSSAIDSAAYGKAYYAAIDPDKTRDTLEKWKVANGYYQALAAGRVTQPRFRDTKDLGYGRGMYHWTQPDGSQYFFVENFQVRSIPGLEYTRLNLDALLQGDRKHHFGTNAIEFSTYPYGAGEPSDIGSTHKFTKFYTFDATRGNQKVEDHANEIRLDTVDLDDRGNKAMPGACAYCHGGTLRPLRADGTFRDNNLNGTAGNGIDGDVNAKLQLLEAQSFQYGANSPYTRAEQEPLIKKLNMAVYCSYPNLPAEGIQVACAQFCVDPENTADCDGQGNDILTIFNTTTRDGEWTGDFAREMVEGWYDDPARTGYFDRDSFNADYVPQAWLPDLSDGSPPAGADQLFIEVVQSACVVCHLRRGTNLGSNTSIGVDKDIDFSSYERFIGHASQIKSYVFDQGVMPLSLRGYDDFWEEGSDAPEILATHLNSVLPVAERVEFNADNEVDPPGSPVADAGPDRTTTSPVRMFGSNSRFVDTYQWSIVSQPDGSDAVLTEDNTAAAVLTTSVDGDYVIQLDASVSTNPSASGLSSDTVLIKIDSMMSPDPKTLTFETHIRPIFSTAQDPVNSTEADIKSCDECHQVATGAGAIDGVPVYWRDEQPLTGDTASNTFYREVMARVDLKNPENSLILLKPANNHHFGGLREGFEVDNPANRQNYDLILNWIMEGAVER